MNAVHGTRLINEHFKEHPKPVFGCRPCVIYDQEHDRTIRFTRWMRAVRFGIVRRPMCPNCDVKMVVFPEYHMEGGRLMATFICPTLDDVEGYCPCGDVDVYVEVGDVVLPTEKGEDQTILLEGLS